MSTKKLIGRIPVSKGEYVAGQTYNRLSQVTLYGSTYQSRVDGNTTAPAILDTEGNAQHTNTDQWLVIADGKEAYNAGEKLSCFSLADDEEGRLQMTTDAEGKVISFRDSDGTLHEHKIAPTHLSLSDEAAKEINEAFKSAGIKMENPSDFSKDLYVELPIPRIAAQVKIYAPKLPTTKTENIEACIEYNDKDGNYFLKPVILNAQGSSSMNYYVKNMAIDINDGSIIKFGDFPSQDSFHLKKYYIDIFRGQCIVGYHLMEQVYKSRPIGEQYPYEYALKNDSTMNGLGSPKKDFFTGAKCHPDGFPINVVWVNTSLGVEKDMGIFAWNLKKHRDVYYCEKNSANNIILDGVLNKETLFGGNIDWTQFEIRNPKSLIDINEKKYNGDNPTELSNTDKNSKTVKDYIIRLAGAKSALSGSVTKDKFEEYFIVPQLIDYFLQSQITYNYDGFAKNWIWCTWDGLHWVPTIYDEDSIFGASVIGTLTLEESADNSILKDEVVCPYLIQLYTEEMQNRYKELRDNGIFTVQNIIGLLNDWVETIGFQNIKKEIEIYNETPSYRKSYLNPNWICKKEAWVNDTFDYSHVYSRGDTCVYKGHIFEAKEQVTGIAPVSKLYSNYPYVMGFFNSISRVKNWLDKRIGYLDKYFNYK